MSKRQARRGRKEFLGVFYNGKLLRGPAQTLKQVNRWRDEVFENRAACGLDVSGLYVQRYEP